MGSRSIEKHRWWKEAVVYQVYPSTFLDANGDGWGDVPGIISKVPYLKELGVDVVWVSPIYKSPQVDMGYDISDYYDIDPKYGTMADVERLIAELKRHGMHLMMDIVANHTSDQHPWFLESKSATDNAKRNWYIWKKGKVDAEGNPEPPNNWCSILKDGNSGWTYDKATDEWYLSVFTPEQPDLNWELPEVRQAVQEVMRFWLDKGASGFRLDVINMISKLQTFPDADVTRPHDKYQPGTKYFVNGPRLHEFLKELNRTVFSKYDTITVGEMPAVSDDDEILKVVGSDREELNMIFIFDLVDIDIDKTEYHRFNWRQYQPKEFFDIVKRWQRVMIERDGWNTLFLENHDNPRSVSRYLSDSDEYRDKAAKLLALLQTTLSGTVYVYQGEEIGMKNAPLSWDPKEYKDVESISFWEKINKLYPGDSQKLDEARRLLQLKARDHARTPVQWDSSANAGFCKAGVEPWMRVNDDFRRVNVAAQMKPSSDGDLSVWQFWQRGLENRKKHKGAFIYGNFIAVNPEDDNVFAYTRTGSQDGTWLVVLNFSKEEQLWEVPPDFELEAWVAGNYTPNAPDKGRRGTIRLKPFEGLLGRCV
ncbi:glycoside hydrolase family 13 protein [Xylona heveae TC161]|uniref:Glycoside hydrolase family 13 protein n=1 Tax=Xylona heveae (strain CBS 132557 / TC161) TaxID=1328760 RepID=A0A165GJ00_XYLHT|nr:glycoside hydrolase family 13 protein [Xylona heveae TC161]KZF22244.1 glycoside hydrolase family 13 protein [Xylona heveae TC161]